MTSALRFWRGDRHHQDYLPDESIMKDTTKSNLILDRSGPRLKTAALIPDATRGTSVKYATRSQNNGKLSMVKNEVKIGTWNVRSLSDIRKVEVLANELKTIQWNIVGIAEMRWLGIGEMTTDDDHKVWYSGDDTKRMLGVGFIVEKKRQSLYLNAIPIQVES